MELGLIAGLVSFIAGMILYPVFIKYLKNKNIQQTPSEFALDEYKNKPVTPAFGGVLFVLIPIVVALIFGGVDFEMWLVVFIYLCYASIGFIDDLKIARDGKNDGLSPKQKLMMQFVLALIFYVLYLQLGGDNILVIPGVNWHLDLGYFYFIFILLFFAGFSNAVNLTDGMDGLAGGTSIIAIIPLIYFAHSSNKLGVSILIFAVIGGLLSFLNYNRKPAQIFMGDVGSLALGALFASLSVVLNVEILMLIFGFVFVYETACVILQQLSWRIRKKKIFRYTPIHYSYTLKGWKEKDVVNFFYALGLIFMILGIVVSNIS